MVEGFWQTPAIPTLIGLALVFVCLFLGVMFARSIRRHGFALQLAHKRARRISESVRMFRMAEEIAGLGVWQYFPQQDRQRWSQGMKLLFGIEPGETLMAGDLETLLSSNGIDLVSAVSNAARTNQDASTRFEIHRLDGHRRVLQMKATRLYGRNGHVRSDMAVLMDVTDQAHHIDELEMLRAEAVQEAEIARKLANTDPLTGIANRRQVMAKLDTMVIRARQEARPLVLIIFDIDHFKGVNDRYGHPAGDQVLKRIAQITCDQSRENDVVGRIGGEEFVWVVRDADPTLARVLSERLRQAIAAGSSVAGVPAVTISVGFAAPEATDTALTLFARADAALYKAKEGGRNTVRMAA
jgi:diguanylate cyclase (GGDEF)-like protein